ncbi:MAG TPA: hypothetical protein VNJ50_04635 [Gelidibacter sp.]|uniref:hypothetical protein n=1 Tax=Gelidibacter sp. TaxID=2018083 RepID=UPI002C94C9E9|nr:hypothetical protein [Gelidibacter sp.]HXJ98110.1 hypothetical protein [Gelidibacter sp.]
MSILVDIIIAICLIGYNSFEIVRINVFKIDKNALFTGLTSMISIGFGLYLIIKNGLILDYGTQPEISINWAGQMWFMGVVCLFIGLGFILSSIMKYIIWKLKRNEHNKQ